MGRWGKGGREGEMEAAVQEGCWVLVRWVQRGAALRPPCTAPPPRPPPAPHSRWVPTHCSHSRAQLELPCNGLGGSFTPPPNISPKPP